jgi:hypothetical protein
MTSDKDLAISCAQPLQGDVSQKSELFLFSDFVSM